MEHTIRITNFRYLEDKKIKPGIKVRKNSVVSPRNNRLRNKEAISTNKGSTQVEEEKEIWIIDGWLKRPFHLSKECLGNTHLPPGFKTW